MRLPPGNEALAGEYDATTRSDVVGWPDRTGPVPVAARARDSASCVSASRSTDRWCSSRSAACWKAAGAAGLDGDLDRVPGRAAAARGAQRQGHRLRHHRRGAADLRPGRGRTAALCRLRAAGAAGRGDPRSQGLADPRRCRAEGPQGRLQQGLERPVPAGQGTGGRRHLHRHRAGLPAARRRPRRRARLGRRLGDLGPVPGRRPGPPRVRARWPTARAW